MDEKKSIASFVRGKIELLNQDTSWSKATLAKLRRGIGKEPGSVSDIWEITLGNLQENWQSKDGKPTFAENAIHTALTLFALHQQGKTKLMCVSGKDEEGKWTGNSLGRAVRKLIHPEKNNEQAIKRRFDAVATSESFTELTHHARGLIQLLKSEDIPLDYPMFADDLYNYQFTDGANRIRLKWGQDYYHRNEKTIEKE
jgi:CRISPR system Cascade subunit CasB